MLSMCLACWMARVAVVRAHLKEVGMHSGGPVHWECAPLPSIKFVLFKFSRIFTF